MVNPPPVRDHDPLFDDAWYKFAWGFEHAKSLHTELIGFQDLQSKVPGSITTRSQFESKSNRFSIIVGALEPYPKRFALMLGDVLHNYRSALDAATWAAVKRGSRASTLARAERNRVGFPDMLKLSDLRAPKFPTLRAQFAANTLAYKAPGISRPDAAVLRWAQRFDLAERSRYSQPLALLADKNNVDKHKTLEILGRKNTAYILGVANPRNCIVKRVEPRSVGHILEVGTELARVFVTPTGPNPDIEVNAHVAVDITINQVPSLFDFLNSTRRFVVAALSGFSDCPPDVSTQLGV